MSFLEWIDLCKACTQQAGLEKEQLAGKLNFGFETFGVGPSQRQLLIATNWMAGQCKDLALTSPKIPKIDDTSSTSSFACTCDSSKQDPVCIVRLHINGWLFVGWGFVQLLALVIMGQRLDSKIRHEMK